MIIPLNEYVLIKPSIENVTAGGILLPDNQEKPQIGKVIASNIKTVKKSDTVIYKKWGTNEVQIEGEDLIFVEKKDIMGIWRKK